MNRKHVSTLILSLGSLVALTSCFGQLVKQVVKEDYPGTAIRAIPDNNGKPANTDWVVISDRELPAPQAVHRGSLTYHSDGLPYAYPSGYKNVVISPYAPYNPISYEGMKAHDKAWDPYSRKPFHIPSTMPWN